jgi:hypothetical protein
MAAAKRPASSSGRPVCWAIQSISSMKSWKVKSQSFGGGIEREDGELRCVFVVVIG